MVKGQKLPTPTDPVEAEEYHARRKKNNAAAMACRQRKEEKIKECDELKKHCSHLEMRLAESESENHRLRLELLHLRGPSPHHDHDAFYQSCARERIFLGPQASSRTSTYPAFDQQHSAASNEHCTTHNRYQPSRINPMHSYPADSYQPNNPALNGFTGPQNTSAFNQALSQPPFQAMHVQSTRGSLCSFSSSTDESTLPSNDSSPVHNPYQSLSPLYRSPAQQPVQHFLSGFLAPENPTVHDPDDDRPGDFVLTNFDAREPRGNGQGAKSAKDNLTPCSQYLMQQNGGVTLPVLQADDVDMLSPLFEGVELNDKPASSSNRP